MWRLALASVYLSSTLIAAPCLGAAQASPKQKSRSRALTLSQFVERVKIEGDVSPLPAVFIKLLELPSDSTWRSLNVSEAEADDRVMRGAYVVYSKAASGDEAAPVALYWNTRVKANRRSENYQYRTALDGTLERALRVDGETDETGTDIRGKSKLTKLDIGDVEVRERFQREVLDFWLKGKGRKKAGAKVGPAKQPHSPANRATSP